MELITRGTARLRKKQRARNSENQRTGELTLICRRNVLYGRGEQDAMTLRLFGDRGGRMEDAKSFFFVG